MSKAIVRKVLLFCVVSAMATAHVTAAMAGLSAGMPGVLGKTYVSDDGSTSSIPLSALAAMGLVGAGLALGYSRIRITR
ncbi:MAG: hypothetical protein FWG08_03760 [Propionibacteriaceae bacterium]|nr:hypothetical protein [Propionibacteriaceae bacterium]